MLRNTRDIIARASLLFYKNSNHTHIPKALFITLATLFITLTTHFIKFQILKFYILLY